MKNTLFILFFFTFSFANGQQITWTPLYEPGSGGRMAGIGVSPHDPEHVIITGDMLGVGVSFDQAQSWDVAGFGLPSYECAEVTFHPVEPATVWMGTMSGPCVSYDSGITWQVMRNGFPDIKSWYYTVPVDKVVIDPDNNSHLLAFAGSHRQWNNQDQSDWGSVWESFDDGNSWSRIGLVDENVTGKFGVMAVSHNKYSIDTIYAALDNAGVYASFDGGYTWKNTFTSVENKQSFWVECHPENASIVYAALDNYDYGMLNPGGIMKSVDAGNSWTAINNNLPQIIVDGNAGSTSRYDVIRIAPSQPDILFTSNTGWNKAGLYLSSNAGSSWAETAVPDPDRAYPAGKSMEIACFDPNNDKVVFAAGSSYILGTTDGGNTWADMTSYHPQGSQLWRGRGYSGLVSKAFAYHPTKPHVSAFAAMDAGNFWISTNNQYTWMKGKSDLPNWGGGNDLVFTGETSVFVALGQNNIQGIARSDDLGNNFTILQGSGYGLPASGTNGKITRIYAFPNDSSRVWAIINKQLYYSNDYGNSWSVIFDAVNVNYFCPIAENNLSYYLATDDGIYQGAGINISFELSTSFKASFVTVHPNNPNTLYICGYKESNGGVWKYKNSSLTQLMTHDRFNHVAINPDNPSTILAIMEDQPYHDQTFAKGVYLSTNAGDTWSLMNNGLPVLRGSTILFNPHDTSEIVFGSGGRGFFKGKWADNQITSNHLMAAENNGIEVHPNPTQGFFSIKAANTKAVTLYNMQGIPVVSKQLQNKQISAFGMNISYLPNGLYFLKTDNGIVKLYKE
jgi:photosystem II stability/assembly factor-like uncharacterized protein